MAEHPGGLSTQEGWRRAEYQDRVMEGLIAQDGDGELSAMLRVVLCCVSNEFLGWISAAP